MTEAKRDSNVLDFPKTNREQELERITRLVQFARMNAFDMGEYDVSEQLAEVERQLSRSLADIAPDSGPQSGTGSTPRRPN